MKFVNAETKNHLNNLNDLIKQGKNVFVLIYMNGCGPCEATKPEWLKINSLINDKEKKQNIIVSQIEKDILDQASPQDIINLKDVSGFPTIRHYSDNGSKVENYENNRSGPSFVEWINRSAVNNKIPPINNRISPLNNKIPLLNISREFNEKTPIFTRHFVNIHPKKSNRFKRSKKYKSKNRKSKRLSKKWFTRNYRSKKYNGLYNR